MKDLSEMKTVQTNSTIADILMVLRVLPQAEIDQLEAFSGDKFDIDKLAIQLASNNGPGWTIRIEETGEPLAVGGLVQIGTTIWRTWFLANQRAFDDYGWEMTVHVQRTHKGLMEMSENLRIETVALADRPEILFKWYETCGMTRETEMRGYGVNGETAVMYVSTKGAEE